MTAALHPGFGCSRAWNLHGNNQMYWFSWSETRGRSAATVAHNLACVTAPQALLHCTVHDQLCPLT
jgi:hypothetical protein